ncbi:MAG: hypothetical protein MUE85_12050 [Microscillaceae bacterium]|jgi:hypothetical protein|nr:hypothetical protein [Microscillaceae bacterium]
MQTFFDTLFAQLQQAGWQRADPNPFREKVSHNAQVYFTYQSALNTHWGICAFDEPKMLKIRLSGANSSSPNWLQIDFEQDTEVFAQVLIAQQDQVQAENYFGFYFQISAVVKATILAWEQWESNYR